ncbi:MAG: CHAT domain-containing protein, partial [Armatimonadota bacterium]
MRIPDDSSSGTYIADLIVDDAYIHKGRVLTAGQSANLRDVSRGYARIFERLAKPYLASDYLGSLGDRMFQLWLADKWEETQKNLAGVLPHLFVVASDQREILNLGWELLRVPGGEFIGCDPRFALRRHPIATPLPRFNGTLPPGPLRVLLIVSAPRDQEQLDYEREERFLLKALSGAGRDIVFRSGDTGSLTELIQLTNEHRPHVVHLSGHALLESDGLGYFAFEDERGMSDFRSSSEMANRVFVGSPVQCVFVSGCQSGKSPEVAVGGICQGLVSAGVPLAVGWVASVEDEIATVFAHRFYETLSAGESIDRALVQARHEIRSRVGISDPSWTLPVLYSATDQALALDRSLPKPPSERIRANVALHPLPGMVEGYAADFVGRRRVLQRLLHSLRDGSVRVAV